MKDSLDYTEEELRELSTEDLITLKKNAEMRESLFNTQQLVEKLSINSLYGALGNQYFPLFNQDIARAITGNGRYFIRKLANYIEEGLQNLIKQNKPYITYGDTDSVYYHIEPFVEAYINKEQDCTLEDKINFSDNFEKKVIQPIIQRCIVDFSKELNAYNSKAIGAEREIIADKAVHVAKKKYFARVRDSEGTRYPLDAPYIKKMGLEVIKSGTPPFSKQHLSDAIPMILDLTEPELKTWVQTCKDEFIKAPLADISITAGVSNLDYILKEDQHLEKIIPPGGKWPTVPIGARSALVYNKYIKNNNLLAEFTNISAGDKTKRLFLIEPNPLNSNIVAFNDEKFVEKFKEYIDYDMNFEKGFMNPLNIMTNALKWNLENTVEALDEW